MSDLQPPQAPPPDEYVTKVIKYIPSEVVLVYQGGASFVALVPSESRPTTF